MLEEEERTVVDARETRRRSGRRNPALVLFTDVILLRLPTSRRTGDWPACNRISCREKLEGFTVAEGVAELDFVDLLALDEHVGPADRIGLGVVVLPGDDELGVGVEFAQVFGGFGEHAAGAGCRIVQRADGAFLRRRSLSGGR